MSTKKSPLNRPRLKKITGGRVQCIVYLPKQEVDEIDQSCEQTGSSRSNVIAQNYFKGKNTNKQKEV